MFLLPNGDRICDTAIMCYRFMPALKEPSIEITPYVLIFFSTHHIMVDFIEDQEAMDFMSELDIITDKTLTMFDKIAKITLIKYVGLSEGEGKL